MFAKLRNLLSRFRKKRKQVIQVDEAWIQFSKDGEKWMDLGPLVSKYPPETNGTKAKFPDPLIIHFAYDADEEDFLERLREVMDEEPEEEG